MNRKLYPLLALLGVLALLVTACGSTAAPTPTTASQAAEGALTDEEAQTLLIGLGQIKGHLLVSLDLYKSGDGAMSAVHAAHPVVEVFGDIAVLVMEQPGQADKLKGALDAYIDAVNAGLPPADVEKNHAEALAVVDETAQTLAFAGRKNTVEFLGPVVLGLLDIASEEYEEAVLDGRIANTVEYQDAYGFILVAREMQGLMADDLRSRSEESAVKFDGYLKELDGVFPSVTPPASPAPADSVESVAAAARAVLASVAPALALRPEPHAEPEPEPEAQTTLEIPPGAFVIYSGRKEPLIQPVIDAFKAMYPDIEVVLKSGGNSELANALLEEKGNPQADLFITTEVFTVQALYQQGVFENYLSPNAAGIPAQYKQADGGWTAVTLRGRVIMYNTDLVAPEDAPKSIFDLVDPGWRGQIAAANSANGSMQAQVAVMQKLLGDEQTGAWLEGLLDNDVTFFGSHTDVRTAVGAGEFKLGLVNSYYYYLQKAEGSPVGLVIPDQGEGQIGLIVNASAAAIVKGGHNTEAAKRFIDFLLSTEGQKLFAELNYEYPVIPGAPLRPDVEPLDGYRLADVNLSEATVDLNATLDLIEKIGLP